MKALILFLLLLFPLNTAAADITLNEATELSEDYLEFSFEGQQEIPNETEMKIAVYNDDGQMVSLQSQTVSGWSQYNKVPISPEQYLTEENKGTTLKAFLMNKKLIPYASSAIIGKSTRDLEAPLSSSGAATIDWANGATMAVSLSDTKEQAVTLTVNLPSHWEMGATFYQGSTSGDAPVTKEENGKRYTEITVSGTGGRIILQKQLKNTANELELPVITTFYENKSGAVSLSFDDGDYESGVFYDSELEKYGFHGTAMLISDKLIENNTVEKWQALVAKGSLDVGNHSKSHSIKYKTDENTLTAEDLTTDITGAYEQLTEWFPDKPILIFASPWGQLSDEALAEIKKNHFAKRTGSTKSNVNPQGDEWYTLKTYTFNESTAEEMNTWADAAIKNNDWTIEMLHGCKDGASSTYTISKDVFQEHVKYLDSKKEQLWMGSLNEVTAYIKERQNASVCIAWANDTNVALNLTDTLPDNKFFHPLTLIVNVPSHWTNGAVYSQGTVTGESGIVKSEDGKLYVQINAVPDQGEILLRKK